MIKKFLFNEFGVCTNPDKTEIGSGIPHIEISTAYVRGKWTYGVTYMLADRGGAFGTNLSNTNWFKTQEDAIEHALNWVKHWLNVQIEQERNRNSSVCKSAAKIIKEIEKLLPKKRYVQLELFEF